MNRQESATACEVSPAHSPHALTSGLDFRAGLVADIDRVTVATDEVARHA